MQSLFHHAWLIESDQAHAIIVERELLPYVAVLSHFASIREALAATGAAKPELLVVSREVLRQEDRDRITELESLIYVCPVVELGDPHGLVDVSSTIASIHLERLTKSFNKKFTVGLSLALARAYAAFKAAVDHKRFNREIELLELVIHQSGDAMAIVTNSGQILYGNEALWNLGGTTGKLLGSSFEALICPLVSEREQFGEALGQALASLTANERWSTDLIFNQQQPFAHYELNIAAIDKGDGGGIYRVVWLFDRSLQRRREYFQREVLSATTHDLKGPLGAILISAGLIQQLAESDKRTHEIAVRIGSSAKGAIDLVDELLSARRLEDGSLVMRPRPQYLGRLVYDCLDEYEVTADVKRIKIEFVCDESEPLVAVDTLGFRRVLSNLLSNAIKFAPADTVVKVELTTEQDHVTLSVTDSGAGVSPEEAPKLFDRYLRSERHGEIAGFGLGLFVVKSIVEAHGGSVGLRSVPYEATSFSAVFPR